MKTVEAIDLYNEYKTKKQDGMSMGPRIQVRGIATKVGPDPYALPSVELAEDKDAHSKVLCVLPLKDYLKLRHIHCGNEVTIEGNPIAYVAGSLNYVVVKRSKIVTVNSEENRK